MLVHGSAKPCRLSHYLLPRILMIAFAEPFHVKSEKAFYISLPDFWVANYSYPVSYLECLGVIVCGFGQDNGSRRRRFQAIPVPVEHHEFARNASHYPAFDSVARQRCPVEATLPQMSLVHYSSVFMEYQLAAQAMAQYRPFKSFYKFQFLMLAGIFSIIIICAIRAAHYQRCVKIF